MRAKFLCDVGITNVWSEPAVGGIERLKGSGREGLHRNQKPLKLLERIIRASSDEGDVIWEPFGGLCSAAVAAARLGRACYSAELADSFYRLACQRLQTVCQSRAAVRSARSRTAASAAARSIIETV
jgi:site-specific DNA-methyltransferase (adenine-specific)